jgi:hypothetical protein
MLSADPNQFNPNDASPNIMNDPLNFVNSPLDWDD